MEEEKTIFCALKAFCFKGFLFPVYERKVTMSMNNKTLKITITSVMTAIATVIYMLFPEIPLVPGVEHLKMDFSDIPAILNGVISGPWWGLMVVVVKNIIHLTRTTTFGIGEIMNIGMGFVMIFSLIGFMKLFSRLFSKKEMSVTVYFAAGICAVICSIAGGWVLNGVFTPIFFKLSGIPITSAAVFAGVWGSTLLNAIKAAFNILPFYPVYKITLRSFSKNSH